MSKFDRKPETVEARQFTDKEVGKDIAKWAEENSYCRVAHREVTDFFPENVRLQFEDEATQYAFIDDWVVLHEDGKIEVVEAADFPKFYKEHNA